jgi:hypothetical protein
MKGPDRRDVLWIGKIPPTALTDRLVEHDLRLVQVTEASAVGAAPPARAIVIEFDDDVGSFVAVARRSINSLIDHGLLVILCHRNAGIAEAEMLERLGRVVLKTDQYSSVLTAYQRWEHLAFRAAIYNPGPGANVALRLNKSITNSTVRLFLQRAFSDFERLRCEQPSQQGLSGSRVLIIHPSRIGGPSDCFLPKLIKIGPADDIDNEAVVFQEFVRDTVPFNYRPNINRDRRVVGVELAALVQDFVEPAVPFTDAVQSGGSSVLAASLFDGALGNWRRSAVEKSDGMLCESIAGRLKAGLSKEQPHLHSALTEAGLLIATWPDGRKRSDVPYQQCRIHGDLHAGNVFVGTTSGDCILIDFAKSVVGAAATDPAALEVQLAFAAKASRRLLTSLYCWPIELPKLSRDWLPNAVRAVRIFGLAGERDARAYGLAVVDQLLRFAKFPQPKLADRARAVRLAYDMLQKACS